MREPRIALPKGVIASWPGIKPLRFSKPVLDPRIARSKGVKAAWPGIKLERFSKPVFAPRTPRSKGAIAAWSGIKLLKSSMPVLDPRTARSSGVKAAWPGMSPGNSFKLPRVLPIASSKGVSNPDSAAVSGMNWLAASASGWLFSKKVFRASLSGMKSPATLRTGWLSFRKFSNAPSVGKMSSGVMSGTKLGISCRRLRRSPTCPIASGMTPPTPPPGPNDPVVSFWASPNAPDSADDNPPPPTIDRVARSMLGARPPAWVDAVPRSFWNNENPLGELKGLLKLSTCPAAVFALAKKS